MTEPAFTIALLSCTVLLGEFVLWRLFRQRVDPIIFPSEQDTSQLGFFSIARMRSIAAIHTATLVAWTIVSILWLS